MTIKLFTFTCFLLFTVSVKSQQKTNSNDSLHQIPAKSPVTRSSKVFTKVEVEAEFPGGAEGWKKYLEEKLDTLVPVKRNAPAGIYEVMLRFVVYEDGTITDVMTKTDQGYGMEEEAKRIIIKGPKWIPAMQNGKQVNAYRNQPVAFVVGKYPE